MICISQQSSIKKYHFSPISSRQYAASVAHQHVTIVPTEYTTGDSFTDPEYSCERAAEVLDVYSEHVYEFRKAHADEKIEILRMDFV